MDKKKKFFHFLKTVPMKLYIVLAAIIVFAFFSNDFGLVDIQKTAVILAAGVDKSENGFTLSAQISVPQGGGTSGAATSTVTLDAEGETVSDCISTIFAESGWVPKLVFCDLVILGEEAAKDDAVACFDFFLRNEYMPDSAHIATCEGTAKEILTSTSALDDSPSQAIQKLFTQSAQSSGRVITSSLKEFAISYYGVSESGYMPYLTTSEQKSSANTGGGSGGGSGGSGGSSGASGGAQSKEQKSEVVYNAERTAIFQKGKMVDILSPQETFAFNLVKGNIYAGTFSAEENGKPVTLSILKNDGGVKIDAKSNPKINVDVSVKVRLYNRGVPSPVDEIAKLTVSDELLNNAKFLIEKDVGALVEKAKNADCDLFQLKKQLYRSSPKKFAEWKELVPSSLETNLKAQVTSVK